MENDGCGIETNVMCSIFETRSVVCYVQMYNDNNYPHSL